MASTTSKHSSSPFVTDLGGVCSLSPQQLSERLAWIRREILPHALRTERFPSGFAWELDAAPGLAAKLDQLVALERECCEGIAFDYGKSAEPGRLRLEVRGVDPESPALRALELPAASGASGASRGARLAKAGGFGFLASLAICCAVPFAASALIGGVAAVSLARLDGPWPIALGAIALGALAWWRLDRRARDERSTGASSCACASNRASDA